MIVVRELDDPGFALPASVVTIGSFDGVHLGHRRLVEHGRDLAGAARVPLVVVSFDRHPLRLLAPSRVPALLTTPGQRDGVLEGLGVGVLYLLHFGHERASQDPDAFVRDVLVERLGVRAVVVGSNFTYGAKGAGRPEDLEAAGHVWGFQTFIQPLLEVDDGVVSSSRIRQYVATGDLEAANRLLGRAFALEGVVVAGDGRGRELGFPTANVVVSSSYATPPDGVYAGWARVERGEAAPAAISLGTRPTFYPRGGPRLLEVYLLDQELDLYGRSLEVAFHSRLRPQEHFESVEALMTQMRDDVAAVRVRTGTAASWAR